MEWNWNFHVGVYHPVNGVGFFVINWPSGVIHQYQSMQNDIFAEVEQSILDNT